MSDEHDDAWGFYPLMTRDQPGSCLVNLSLADESRQQPLPIRLLLRIAINSEDFGGMGSTAEREALDAAVEECEKQLERCCGGVLAGHQRTPGELLVGYYCAKEPEEAELRKATVALKEWKFESNIEHDPEWEFYHQTLSPSPIEHEWMNNSEVERSLGAHGDGLTAPREVTHWAYFPTEAAAHDYARRVGADGFEVVGCELSDPQANEDGEDADNDEPLAPLWKVQFTKDALPTADEMSPITLALRELAAECSGEYDGWETILVKGGAG